MERNELIKKMTAAAQRIAKTHGCDVLVAGKDEQKGVWGKDFTQYLERSAGGDCSSVLKWNREDGTVSVTFDFRFSSPRITVRSGDALACAEVNSPWDDELKAHRPEGPWAVKETLVQNPYDGGNRLLREITSRLRRILARQ